MWGFATLGQNNFEKIKFIMTLIAVNKLDDFRSRKRLLNKNNHPCQFAPGNCEGGAFSHTHCMNVYGS